DGTITGPAPAAIYYDTLGMLWLATGTGTETVNIQALNAPTTWVVAHSNNTTINLGSAGSVAGVHTGLFVRGDPTPSGGWASPHVVVDDSADTGRQNLSVIPTVFPNVAPYWNYNSEPPSSSLLYETIAGFPGLTVFAPHSSARLRSSSRPAAAG